jgi:hypothetical protein
VEDHLTDLRTAAVVTVLSLGAISACSGKPADRAPGPQASTAAAAAPAQKGEAMAAAPGMPAMIPGHPQAGGQAAGAGMMSGASASQTTQVTEPIPPAPGGTSIATLWTNRKALAGKTVILRGKVVKFNGGILGRNWIHIQDGTGVAADGTNDVLVTSDAVAKIGDIITATGTVAVDKDFTAGYVYAVMIESATIQVK